MSGSTWRKVSGTGGHRSTYFQTTRYVGTPRLDDGQPVLFRERGDAVDASDPRNFDRILNVQLGTAWNQLATTARTGQVAAVSSRSRPPVAWSFEEIRQR